LPADITLYATVITWSRERRHNGTIFEEPVDDMPADEAGGPRYQRASSPHATRSIRISSLRQVEF
jgi:hypothetical protein